MRTRGKHSGPIAIAAAALLAAALTGCAGGRADSGPFGPITGSPRSGPPPTSRAPVVPRSDEPDEPVYLPDDPETPDGPVTSDPTGPTEVGDNTVSGHTYSRDGSPMADVMIYFRIVPMSYGGLYRTSTDADGAYSYDLPGGVYTVLASTPGEPDVSVYLTPRQAGPDGVASITVPPGHVVDFDES